MLFEDDSLLVLDKPARLPASPDRLDPDRPSLIKLLHEAIRDQKPWAVERNLNYLMNAHRLDDVVTGTLLFAKNKKSLVALANQFGSQTPMLTCLALVKGAPRQDRFNVEVPITQDMRFPERMRAQPQKGKKSHTQCEVVERFRGFAALRCVPLTERRHQIRVHLQYVGLPVCGDRVYGGRPLLLSSLKPNYRLKPNRTERPLIVSAAVHAQSLSFDHPVSGQPIRVEAPPPKDLQVALKYLRQFASDAAGDDVQAAFDCQSEP